MGYYDPECHVFCPMPDCGEILVLAHSAAYTLSPSDLADVDAKFGRVEDAHSSAWQVECTAGHVILLPGDSGCPCDPDRRGQCVHDVEPAAAAKYDYSDDYRTFRSHDLDRLRAIMTRLSAPTPAS